jgi:polysaccharide biosynthesis transport protein
MDLISILRILKAKIWVLIVFPAASVMCAFFFASIMDREYKSTAQLATGFTSDEVVNLNDEKSSNPFEVNTKFVNTIESMKSVSVLSLVSYRLLLHDLEDSSPFRKIKNEDDISLILNSDSISIVKKVLKDRLNGFMTLNSFNEDDRIILEILGAYNYDFKSVSEELIVYRRSTSDFITVEFVSENPFISAFVVNVLCEEFIRYNKILKTDISSESIDFFYALMEEKRKSRDLKAEELSNFKVRNNIFNYGAESENKIKQISDYQFEKELEEKNISGLILSLKMVKDKINNYQKTDKAEVARINQRIIELRKSINDLDASLDSNKNRLAQLREELQLEISRLDNVIIEDNPKTLDELNNERNKLELELQISNANLTAIERSLSRLRIDASGFASTESRLVDLQRELDNATDEYKEAQEKYSSAKVKTSVIGSSLRQVLLGQPSDKPEPSKAILLIGLSGAGSFVFCVLIILALELGNFSIRNQNRLESYTGIKNVAVLNGIELQPTELNRIFDRKDLTPELEAFVHFVRKLRFEIQGTKDQVILITSTKANAGKTFVTIALSYSLSLLNKRVLIIDTNFKSRSLTDLLIPKNNNGRLIDRSFNNLYLLNANSETGKKILNDEGKLEDPSNERNVIQKTKFLGVDIIGNYGGNESPSEILAGKQFDKMIDSLAIEYDYIMLEGPALNDYADTNELIEYVDKVVAVFDAQTVLNNQDFESVKYLKSIHNKLLGTILNRVSMKDLVL